MSFVEQTGRLAHAAHASQSQSQPSPQRAPSFTPPTPPRSPTPPSLASFVTSFRGSASPTHPASQTADYGERSSPHSPIHLPSPDSSFPDSSFLAPGFAQSRRSHPTSQETADYGERPHLHSHSDHDPDSSFFSINSYDFFAPSFASS
ncbi:hypothetical protein EXIGLDRAFT_772514 [Exidia glandulosa HHB12029]|uniref:Uncharacterized protein n=1 Tax=Exidia glandulosa HHB12029 TaxID=1314781 RepID=A0A165F968_EXIGL|nr:hypothetical protein EXIGLDRAFT_772514 [Exidia glandulosa HHB12029]